MLTLEDLSAGMSLTESSTGPSPCLRLSGSAATPSALEPLYLREPAIGPQPQS